ncbi:serine/threonine-protein kinase [Roseofilum sp. BLCC_M154]|uniref:Serine/threonine-protein kinase n=1 Tax=Roseofilum acuticapitatum BLCC-M154 TaxID=3022444 RepID=A0ABT7AN69_9CYAN|nr:serine/threonine-protein kinase [Roseofilum acuticapitatum]MDJ1168343.1 serine/threonine-protein kinase [Roseofilum acuticapitatum BLCC-M154]
MTVPRMPKTKYLILGLIGQGQFGRVFCGCHRKTGKLVALKDLDKYRFPTHQFLRELRFLLQLSHPNIVTCRALEHSRQGRYLVMDYCEGGTLRNWMDRQERFPLGLAIQLIQDVLKGMEHANSRGIIHRDLKPENILLTLKSAGWMARISDFGIARLVQESQEASDSTGSPAYMAPERFYGQYSLQSDIYAVGVILYELVVGDRPFSGQPQQLMTYHLNQRVSLPETVHPALQKIILKSLEKLPARRYKSAREMLADLERLSGLIDLSSSASLMSVISYPPSRPLIDRPIATHALPGLVADLAVSLESKLNQDDPLCGSSRCIYWAIADLIQCQCYQEASQLDTLVDVARVSLPEPVRQLKVTSEGCFALTDRCIYYVSPYGSASSWLSAELIAHIPMPFKADVHAQGDWIAAITEDLYLWIWHRGGQNPEIKGGNQNWLSRPPVAVNREVDQIQILDDRYGLFWRVEDGKSWIEVFTRRGSFLGQWKLYLEVDRVIPSAIPYRVLVIPKSETHAPLLMDLKPFRVRPIPIKVQFPVCAAIASWGYIIGDRRGHLILLDEYGQVFGRILGPCYPVAIAIISKTMLLVATNVNQEGELHLVDLTQFDIDFIF